MKMKMTFLATTAAIALIAGAGIASAQRQEAPASNTQAPNPAPKAQQEAPAEKTAPRGPVAPDKSTQSKPANPQTTGQVQPQKADEPPAPGSNAPPKNAERMNPQPKTSDTVQKPDAQPPKADTAQKPAASPTTGQATRPAGAAVTLNDDQKKHVRDKVLTRDAPRVGSVNFSLNVGIAVPRTVRVVPMSPILVEYYPAWRGYTYFVVGDQIVVVDPRTHEIVAVLDV